MDNVNYKRYKIVKTKTVKIVSTEFVSNNRVFTTEVLSGEVNVQPDVLRITTTSKIVTMNLPGAAFDRGGKIVFGGEGSGNAEFFDLVKNSRLAALFPRTMHPTF